MKRTWLLLAASCVHVGWMAALWVPVSWCAQTPPDDPRDLAQLDEVQRRQLDVRQRLERAGEQLSRLETEFRSSGVDDPETLGVLRALRRVLAELTAEQLQEVLQALQRSRTAQGLWAEPAQAAFTGQQAMIARLRAVLDAHERNQSAHRLAEQVRGLMDRQHAAMRSAIDLARAHGERIGLNPDERIRTALAAQATQQQSLTAELESLLQRMDRLAASSDGEVARRVADAASEARRRDLARQMAQAAGDLQTAALYRAANGQRASRDGLRAVWQRLLPPRDETRRLADAAAELQQLIDAQLRLAEQTDPAPTADPARPPGTTPPPPSLPAAAPAELERAQADLVDRTDLARSDLTPQVPHAAETVREAMRQMQQARAALDRAALERAELAPAAQAQRQAAETLQQARDQVLAELARLLDNQAARQTATQQPRPGDASADTPASPEDDRLGASRQALSAVRALRDRLEALREQTAQAQGNQLAEVAPAQRRLGHDTARLAEALSPLEPAAAEALAQASARMNEAAAAMDRPPPLEPSGQPAEPNGPPVEPNGPPAEPNGQAVARAQQAAAERLSAAERQLARRVGELEQASGELEQVRRAAAMLDAAVARQQEASQTTRQLASPDAAADATTETARALAQQDAARSAVEAARPQVQAASSAAAQSLDSARAAMSAAAESLSRAAPRQAQSAQRDAEDALARARAQLDERAAAVARSQASSPPTSAGSLARVRQVARELSPAPSSATASSPPAAAAGPSPQDPANAPVGSSADPRAWDGRRDGGAVGAAGNAAADSSGFLGLPPRERAALQQGLSERIPPEYVELVEQYLRHLARLPPSSRRDRPSPRPELP